MLDEGTPLFLQIAGQLSSDIVDGVLAEGGRVPSTNEFAAFYRINPATAAKGINVLVDDGILEKRRGIGMFVVAGARDRLVQLRRKEFAEQYVDPLVTEARRLGIDTESLIEMIRRPRDVQRPDPPDQLNQANLLNPANLINQAREEGEAS
jgi:GntR family transcriptional regulator